MRRKDGQPIVAGCRINSFTNAEESVAGMTKVVPFLLETRLRELGASRTREFSQNLPFVMEC